MGQKCCCAGLPRLAVSLLTVASFLYYRCVFFSLIVSTVKRSFRVPPEEGRAVERRGWVEPKSATRPTCC